VSVWNCDALLSWIDFLAAPTSFCASAFTSLGAFFTYESNWFSKLLKIESTSASVEAVCSLALMSLLVLQNAALSPFAELELLDELELDELPLLPHAPPTSAAITQAIATATARVPRISCLRSLLEMKGRR